MNDPRTITVPHHVIRAPSEMLAPQRPRTEPISVVERWRIDGVLFAFVVVAGAAAIIGALGVR